MIYFNAMLQSSLVMFMMIGLLATSEVSAAEQSSSTAYESVLERFHHYNGSRDGASLQNLFNIPADRSVRQLPAIAISDGKAAIIIAAKLPSNGKEPLNFTIEGAELISINKIRGDEWQIKALPRKGTMEMALIVISGKRKVIYPLTVAPPVPPDTDISNHAWHEFFENMGNRLDLNGDGLKDYRDDYIFLANYLTHQAATGKDRSARKERALRRSLTVAPTTNTEYDPKDFPDQR